jgi:hypothetical protein
MSICFIYNIHIKSFIVTYNENNNKSFKGLIKKEIKSLVNLKKGIIKIRID